MDGENDSQKREAINPPKRMSAEEKTEPEWPKLIRTLIEEDREKTYTTFELLCVFSWFLLDGLWLMEWKWPTYLFAVVSFVMAAMMFVYIRHERTVVLITCADVSWLMSNTLWAIGDLEKSTRFLTTAKFSFLIGLGFCVAAFAASGKHRSLGIVLGRMRIIRYFLKA